MKTLSVIFYLKKDKANLNQESAIYAKIKVNETETTFSTRLYVSEQRWKETKKLNVTRNQTEKDTRTILGNIAKNIQDLYESLSKQGRYFTATSLKEMFQEPELIESRSLLELFSLHNKIFQTKVQSELRSKASLTKYNSVKAHLKNYLEHKYKAVDFELHKLNFEFIEQFDLYLRTVKKCCNNTTVKYVQFLRTVIATGLKYEWLEKDPFQKYEGQLQEVKTEYLTIEQLRLIESKDFGNERLNIIRDTFLFSCYTGFAPIDVARLTHSDIVKSIDGRYWIKKARTKTKVVATVPLLPPVLDIIAKYKNHPRCIEKNLLVPHNTNSTLNCYLKEIADICRLDINLHFYVARHTFATTITLLNGVSIESVSKMLGHKRVSQTQVYSKITSDKVSKEMQQVFELYEPTIQPQNSKKCI